MIGENRDGAGRYVQYGCGWSAPDRWINFDASPTLRIERVRVIRRLSFTNPEPFPPNVRYGDITRGLPIEDGSCDLLYCSHVLEHLALESFATAVKYSYNLLAPGGVWRIVVPDLRFEAERYLASTDAAAAESFMASTYLGLKRRPQGPVEQLSAIFGNARHLWMWDYESLAARLETAGFSEIRPARFGDSAHEEFSDVEDPDRWENAVGLECRRPR